MSFIGRFGNLDAGSIRRTMIDPRTGGPINVSSPVSTAYSGSNAPTTAQSLNAPQQATNIDYVPNQPSPTRSGIGMEALDQLQASADRGSLYAEANEARALFGGFGGYNDDVLYQPQYLAGRGDINNPAAVARIPNPNYQGDPNDPTRIGPYLVKDIGQGKGHLYPREWAERQVAARNQLGEVYGDWRNPGVEPFPTTQYPPGNTGEFMDVVREARERMLADPDYNKKYGLLREPTSEISPEMIERMKRQQGRNAAQIQVDELFTATAMPDPVKANRLLREDRERVQAGGNRMLNEEDVDKLNKMIARDGLFKDNSYRPTVSSEKGYGTTPEQTINTEIEKRSRGLNPYATLAAGAGIGAATAGLAAALNPSDINELNALLKDTGLSI